VKKEECLIVVSDTAVVKEGRGPTEKRSLIGLTTVFGSAANEGDARRRRSANREPPRAMQ
jgi:hypothetical protein